MYLENDFATEETPGGNTRRKPRPVTRRAPQDAQVTQALETLLTAIDVAKHLGKTVDAASNMMQRGQIPATVRLGRERRVKQSLFQIYLQNLTED